MGGRKSAPQTRRQEDDVTDAGAAPAAPQPRLKTRTKLAFGIGGMAETIALYSISQYLMLFYNQVLGLDAALAGTAMMVSFILDAFVDPIVGSLSDRTRSKLGRRHLYMFAAPIPIALCYVAIFNPPGGLSQLELAAWLALTVSALRIAMAFFHTPHLALGGELSKNYTERSQVMAYNSFFTWAGGSLIVYVALTFFFHKTPDYPFGLRNPEAYAPFSLFAAGATLLILFSSAFFTRDQIPRLPKPAEHLPKFTPFEFLKDIFKVIRNANYRWLLLGYFFLSLTSGVRGPLTTYMTTYYFELTSEQIRYYIIGSFFGFLVAFFASARLHGKYDKKAVMIWSALASLIVPALPVLLRMSGFMFENGDPRLLPTLVTIAAFSFGTGSVLSITVMSALADVADENHLRFGVRQEGVLYATRAIFAKIDTALGVYLSGLVLAFVEFPAKAEPGHVDPAILNHLAWIESPIAMIPGLLAVLFYAQYKITKDSHRLMREKLDMEEVQKVTTPI
jgi:Na+/melibiose symporter-like transporter